MDIIDYHKSTSKELIAIKDRVRNLIKHWGVDGRHQEAVIKTMIKRFLPERYSIANGFVVSPTEIRGEHKPSKEIDLLIYDTSFPVLFRDNDFVIITADAVVGIIEVKANLTNQGLQKVIEKCNENGKFIFESKIDKSKPLFNGIFSYESKIINIELISDKIKSSSDKLDNSKVSFCVNHIAFNKDYFYKYWKNDSNLPHEIYNLNELSFSFFISNLMDWITNTSVQNNRNLWFPIDKNLRSIKQF